MEPDNADVIVAGGGIAGLSAALAFALPTPGAPLSPMLLGEGRLALR